MKEREKDREREYEVRNWRRDERDKTEKSFIFNHYRVDGSL